MRAASVSLLWHSVTLRRYTIGTATHHGARMTRRLPRKRFLVALLGAVIINVSCTGGNGTSANDDDPSVDLTDIDTSLEPLPNDLQDSASFYLSDGYDEVSMLNMLVRTATVDGPCNADDIRGCQLDDVLADLDDSDDLEPAIAVHFSATDYSDDASEANAHLRQSGDTERAAAQKSFALTLDEGVPPWRHERRLQLNKHPFDVERLRNKLAFDLIRDIDHLNSLRTQFVHLNIEDNGQTTDYGVYTHVEYLGESYLSNRGYDTDSAIYQSVNFLFDRLPERLQIDDDGAPVDTARFERNLQIHNGEDHRALVSMLDSLNDASSNKASVLRAYFNDNNIATWLAVNILLGNANTVYENYFLMNLARTDDFYLLPGDFDSAFKTEADPDDYSGQEQIRRRMIYGVSKWWESRLIRLWLQQPGAWETLRGRVYTLRENALSDSRISALIDRYVDVVQPYLLAAPDLDYLYGTDNQNKVIEWFTHIEALPERVEDNYRNFFNDPGWPMSFSLLGADVANGEVTFRWSPSYDFQGDALAYTLDVSATPAFDSVLYRELSITNAPQPGVGGQAEISATVPSAVLGSGELYWRVTVFETDNPDTQWRPANSRVSYNGNDYYGAAVLVID